MFRSNSVTKFSLTLIFCMVFFLSAMIASPVLGATETYDANPGPPMSNPYDSGGSNPGPNPGTYGSLVYSYRDWSGTLVSDVYWWIDGGVGGSGNLNSDFAGFGTGRELDITKSGGGTFTFKGLTLCSFTNKNGSGTNPSQAATVYFQGYNGATKSYDSGPVDIAECGWGSTPWSTYTPPTIWIGIDELRIVSTTDTTFDPFWDNLQYSLALPPTVTGISPASGPTSGGTPVTITGANLSSATSVKFGSTSAAITSNTATQIIANSPGGSAGTVDITVTTDGGTSTTGSADQFTYVAAPAITSASNTTFTVGSSGTFTVTTTGYPTGASMAISESGALPSGVTFTDNHNGTATLAGTPGAGTGATYAITITASNGIGTDATQSFTLTVNQAPAITSVNTTTFTETVAATLTVTTTGFPTGASMVISKTGALPGGVTFTDNNNGTATLAGTPALNTNGNYPITITAGNSVGTNATQNFTLVVQLNFQISSANNATFTAGSLGAFTVTTTGTPTPALSKSGSLPGGVTFTDNSNGTASIGGTPGAGTGGAYPITITAHNGVAPDVTQNFTLTVNEAPSITTQPPDRPVCAGGTVTFTAAAAGFPAPTVRWQMDSGSGFADIGNGGVYSGATTPALTITGAAAGMTGYTYRAVFTNSVNPAATTNGATLTVLTDTSLTVGNNADSGAGSLRDAIAKICPGGTIDFGVTGTITLTSGALAIARDLIITGPGASTLTIDGGGTVQLFRVTGTTSFTLKNLTLANGAANAGGALLDDPAATTTTTITGCVFSGNKATLGGGALFAAGTMAISDTLFSGNSSTPPSYGGAIYAGSGSTMTISNTLFNGNSSAAGGAIANGAAIMTLTNVTMNGNSATAGGGGIFATGNSLNIVNATIAGNSVSGSSGMGGGIAVTSIGTVNLKNSIVAGNTAPGGGPDIYGNVNSQGYNLIETTADATINGDTNGNITGSVPQLGPLANNGGPTHTMALLSGSPALDAGTCTGAPAFDQRGMPRPQNGSCDIGAYELGVANRFTVSVPVSAVAGSSFNYTVTALDALNNIVTGYAGTVHFTSSDGAAILPADTTLTNGVGTFSAALQTAGNRTITATDTLTSSITGTSNAIAVSTAGTTHFAVSAPTTATAGTAINFTVTAQDQFSNTVTGYSGTVHFSSSDGAAMLPANATLTSGVGTFSATLKTAGSRTITATDTVAASISGTSNAVAVSSSAAAHLLVSAPATATPGIAFNFTVTAQDQFNNTATGYTGTLHFTGTDGAATLPANTTLNNGTGTFSATLNTNGLQTITATDTVTGSITGTSNAIVASQAPSITSTGSAAFIIGTASTFTLTTTGFPPPSLSETGVLPSGVSFVDNGNGTATLSGTPAVGTHGTYPVTIIAHNTAGADATQNFTLTVNFNSAVPVLNVSALSDGAVTTSRVINVSGIVTAVNGIQSITDNGASIPFTASGSFSFPVQLAVGANTITVVATDNAGLKTSSARTITLDPTAPSLTITSPADGITTAQTSITVTGTASANTTVTMSVNGGAAQSVPLNGTDFTINNVTLAVGMNTIELTATDMSNAKSSVKLTIISNPAAPDLAITNPAQDLLTDLKALTLTGTVLSSTPSVTVSIAFNGQTFTPTVTTGAFQQDLTLTAEKAYAIIVTATDANTRSSVAQRNVIYSLTATGDVDGNGVVDVVDALMALQASVNLITLTADQLKRGDVAPLVHGVTEPDGKIDIDDAMLILRKAVWLPW